MEPKAYIRGVDCFGAMVFMNADGAGMVVPVSADVESGAGGLMNHVESVQRSSSPKEIGDAVLRAYEETKKMPALPAGYTLDYSSLPIKVKNGDALYYDSYIVNVDLFSYSGVREKGFDIRPWRRDGVMDTFHVHLPETASTQQIGEAVLTCLDYIDKNFGFDKIPTKYQ